MTRAGPWGCGNCEKLQHKPETEIFTHEEKAQKFLKCIVCLVHVAVSTAQVAGECFQSSWCLPCKLPAKA